MVIKDSFVIAIRKKYVLLIALIILGLIPIGASIFFYFWIDRIEVVPKIATYSSDAPVKDDASSFFDFSMTQILAAIGTINTIITSWLMIWLRYFKKD